MAHALKRRWKGPASLSPFGRSLGNSPMWIDPGPSLFPTSPRKQQHARSVSSQWQRKPLLYMGALRASLDTCGTALSSADTTSMFLPTLRLGGLCLVNYGLAVLSSSFPSYFATSTSTMSFMSMEPPQALAISSYSKLAFAVRAPL